MQLCTLNTCFSHSIDQRPNVAHQWISKAVRWLTSIGAATPRSHLQVASFSIAFNQVKNAWGEIFTGTCAHCHGAGSVICPRCSGTKDRRSRPAAVSVTALGFVDGPDFQ
jgi:hypothetical protein